MNPFKSRKKSTERGDGVRRASTDDTPPMPTNTRGRTFRRNKKPVPEPKKEIDLSTALPEIENFRTSLLMTNLSARFSMLREQDDPGSKIGKANDDSVLFPKRTSRLNLFGFDTLGDIAEVSSMHSSIRPPFANTRHESYSSADGYGTDDDGSIQGSVMSRAKPGQGNKFFGGRQKVYKIPLAGPAAAKDWTNGDSPAAESGKPIGRAVYDDDISQSTFQALRAKEKERKASERYSEDNNGDRSSRENDRDSPMLNNYNRNRETSSSTQSNVFDARASTAATSVNSQYGSVPPPNGTMPSNMPAVKERNGSIGPPSVKSRRMYGQGLDQQLYEQQSSAMNRLNSIQKINNFPTSKAPMVSRSATNLNDRFQQRGGALYASTNFRAGSPPPSASPAGLAGFDFGVNDNSPITRDSTDFFGVKSPLSPPMSPGEDSATLIAALEPNDYGKATASGAFNKPKTAYSEEQFAQRQLQLIEGRDTPPPTRSYSRTDGYSERSVDIRNGMASRQSSSSSKFIGNSRLTSPEPVPTTMSHNGEHHAGDGTYLAGFDPSDDDSEADQLPISKPSPEKPATQEPEEQPRLSTKYAFDHQHPAFSGQNSTRESQTPSPIAENDTFSQHTISPFIESNRLESSKDSFVSAGEAASARGGATSALDDLVKGHLRNVSNASSVYPDSEDSPLKLGEEFPASVQQQMSNGTAHQSVESEKPAAPEQGDPESPQASLSTRAHAMLEQAKQLRNGAPKAQHVLGALQNDRVAQIPSDDSQRNSNGSSNGSQNASWQDQMKAHHNRGGSTETQKEREEFANELADRRRRVEDNLKSFVSSDGNLSGLTKKPSFGSLANRGDQPQPSKAIKMLGTPPSQSPTISPSANGNHMPPRAPHQMPPRSESPMGAHRQVPPRPSVGPFSQQGQRSIAAERREKYNQQNSPPQNRIPMDRGRGALGTRPEMRPVGNPIGNPYFLTRGHGEPIPPMSYHPAGRTRKYSPPRQHKAPKPEAPNPFDPVVEPPRAPPVGRSPQPPQGPHFGAQPPTGAPVRGQGASPPQGPQAYYSPAYPSNIGRPSRASPPTPNHPPHVAPPLGVDTQILNHARSPEQHANTNPSTPTMMASYDPSSSQVRSSSPRKRSIQKSEISNPTFLNGTSSVSTVDLPHGASLENGMDEVRRAAAAAPPVPSMNPRRRGLTGTVNPFGNFGRKSSDGYSSNNDNRRPSHESGSRGTPSPTVMYRDRDREAILMNGGGAYDDYPVTDEGGDAQKRYRPRTRLRKTSSEGGSMNAKARHQALMEKSPAMPSSPVMGETRGMF